MAGIKIDNFATDDINLSAIMTTLNSLKIGHFGLTLTNMDNTSECAVAAGSIIEVNGSLVYTPTGENITGTVADGVIYVKLVYSNGVLSAQYTTSAPTYDTSKKGWYGTGGSSGHRYIARMIKSGTSYSDKYYYDREIFPVEFESQFAYQAQRSMAYLETVTVTLTFSRNVKSIINFSLNGGGEGGSNGLNDMRLVSVTISGTQVQTVLQNMRSSSFGTELSYSVMVTAEI